MIVVNLKGGLGNQMFEYAFGYTLAEAKQTDLYLDLRYLTERRSGKGYTVRDYNLDIFGIEPKSPTKKQLVKLGVGIGNFRVRSKIGKMLDRLGIGVISERKMSFDSRVFDRKAVDIYLDGYWQSEKYFDIRADEIARIFQFDCAAFDDGVLRFAETIEFDDAVCLNVRRGDFVGSVNHDVLGIDYYSRALDHVRRAMGDNFAVYVFSDDPEWCRDNLTVWPNLHVVGHEYAGDRFSAYMYLMSQFSNFVIPNSTFAWWAAWLSRAKKKLVIAPRKWTALARFEPCDIVPTRWLKA